MPMRALPTFRPASRPSTGGDGTPVDAKPAETGPPLPRTIGRYEVMRELGRGAMGRVYLGRDPVIGRLVALKTFHVGLGADEEEREIQRRRLMREARSAGLVSHPNIVAVYDVVDDGVRDPFVAMEFVEGATLEEELARGEAIDVAALISQIASALDHLHAHGIVHRDVKPSNVLIGPDGFAKLSDFGVAVARDPQLTQETALFGTPQYIAPELLRGGEPSPRADVFALGVLVYELVTGHKPFSGDTVAEVTHQILSGAHVPPRAWSGNLPREVAAVIERALATDPGRRYGSAGELADALRAALGKRGEEGTIRIPRVMLPREAGWRRIAVAVVVVLLVGLGLAVATGWLEGRVDTPPPEGPSALDLAYQRLLAEGSRLLAAGDAEGAAIVFGTAERMGSGRVEAARLRAVAEARIGESAVRDRLAVARAALAARRYDDVIAEARELLRHEAGRDDALAVLADVEAAIARDERQQQAARRSAARPSSAAPVPEIAALPTPSASLPAASFGRVDVVLSSAVSRGSLAVYAGDRPVVRERFSFPSTSWWRRRPGGGRLERTLQLPVGEHRLRAWLTRDGEAAQLVEVTAAVSAAGPRVLELLLPTEGPPSAELR